LSFDRAFASSHAADHASTTKNRLQILDIYAHEINNHLTIIVGSCDLASSPGATPAEVAEKLVEIRAAALMIARLAKGLEPLQH
jgi:hypothetical protein